MLNDLLTDLGTYGEQPFGAKPAIFLSVRKGEAASAFAMNRGYGGDFTISGALDLRVGPW